MQGTAEKAISKDRIVSHETTTSKLFGKTSNTDRGRCSPPNGTTPPISPRRPAQAAERAADMEKAYDDLDGDSKQRLHQNMQDMAQMMPKAFGSQTLWSGEKTGATKTYAGETCEEHTFGSFTVCSMKDAPAIPLHLQGSLSA